MSRSKRGGIVAVVTLVVLSLAAAAFAITTSPKNGTYKGNTYYTAYGKKYKASLTVTVSHHKISRAQLQNPLPGPVDQTTSKNGSFCGAANSADTKGYKETGGYNPNKTFKFTFRHSSSTSTSTSTDKVTVTGSFTSATKAVLVYRDINTFSSSAGGFSDKCDTGKLHFTIKHT